MIDGGSILREEYGPESTDLIVEDYDLSTDRQKEIMEIVRGINSNNVGHPDFLVTRTKSDMNTLTKHSILVNLKEPVSPTSTEGKGVRLENIEQHTEVERQSIKTTGSSEAGEEPVHKITSTASESLAGVSNIPEVGSILSERSLANNSIRAQSLAHDNANESTASEGVRDIGSIDKASIESPMYCSSQTSKQTGLRSLGTLEMEPKDNKTASTKPTEGASAQSAPSPGVDTIKEEVDSLQPNVGTFSENDDAINVKEIEMDCIIEDDVRKTRKAACCGWW